VKRRRNHARGHHPRAFQPEPGERFGLLVALRPAPDYRHPRGDRVVVWWWLCCGCDREVRMRPVGARANVRKLGWCGCRACYFASGGWKAIARRRCS
jgi:hypothetical protein